MNIVQSVEDTVNKIITKDVALLLVRLPLGLFFLGFGVMKLMNLSMMMSAGFPGMGFPGWLAPVVGVLEVVGGLSLILGKYTTWNAYQLAVITIVGTLVVHLPMLGGVPLFGAGDMAEFANVSRNIFALAGLVVIMAFGNGSYAMDK